MMCEKDAYLILLVFLYILSDFMINMVCLSIIVFEALALLKAQFTTQFEETLHH